MIKNFSKLLLCAAIALTSCSSVDEPEMTESTGETAKVAIGISRADAQEFTEAGITNITVFVYHNERKGTTLFCEKTMDVADGMFEMEFPIGETYQTFVVANAPSITEKEEIATVAINLDPKAPADVWMSQVVKFASDKSVSEVELTLNRRVARVSFEPAETAEELAAITDYDNLNIRFTNIATKMLVSGAKAEAGETTVSASAADGFKATIYTFDTSSLAVNGKLFLEYTKGGAVVNTSRELDCATSYGASKRVKLIVPITDPGLVENPWSGMRARAELRSPITFEISEF
ncbi:MAG: FimB/Mfa2 family fimbrial subunit [Muribaculaceae bacterium]|nr:FimB/Mfa2 family fimbrial subunit [Muribaculaceae bacterium]